MLCVCTAFNMFNSEQILGMTFCISEYSKTSTSSFSLKNRIKHESHVLRRDFNGVLRLVVFSGSATAHIELHEDIDGKVTLDGRLKLTVAVGLVFNYNFESTHTGSDRSLPYSRDRSVVEDDAEHVPRDADRPTAIQDPRVMAVDNGRGTRIGRIWFVNQ